jgi:four helix bundle protein
MATIQKFEDLEVWKQARALAQSVFQKSMENAFAKDFALKDQINRSAGSIMDNIAEGFERDGKSEFILFLSYAKASAGETRSQLYRAKDRGYLNETEFNELVERCIVVGKMLGGFIAYLKKADVKGTKFKVDDPNEDYLKIIKDEFEI